MEHRQRYIRYSPVNEAVLAICQRVRNLWTRDDVKRMLAKISFFRLIYYFLNVRNVCIKDLRAYV